MCGTPHSSLVILAVNTESVIVTVSIGFPDAIDKDKII